MTTYLTTKEVAALMRVKERKVYDLVSRSLIPFHKTTGKLLFQRDEIMHWLENGTKPINRPATITGSHDPCLEDVMRQSGAKIASIWNGSSAGLTLLEEGNAAVSALHIFDPEDQSWNINAVRERFSSENFVLIEWARRQRGLITTSQLEGRVNQFSDISGHRVCLRQKGSGTQLLFDYFMAQNNVDLSSIEQACEKHTELEAVLTLIEGVAEISFGLEYLARRYKLGFVPVLEERVDLLVSRQFYFEGEFQQFLSFCKSPEFHQIRDSYPGYDFGHLGTVHFNSS